ncbi:CHAT domain-containing protein [Nonomuraea angiospora]|uniref:CHAT domain-containing protein n=1 Tax=Nonomuraea angiospora TaxID=46172 RepID=UPI0029A90C59|nr:CHAT domain-containing protein [Nonomuraea angiospora]MDX3104629.1 CHAT domain-containing protein [Nonomuraea angiospora]
MAERLHERMPDALSLIGTATRAQVLAALPECTIAHFACHGVSDLADPSESRLLLRDHDSAPLTVSSLASVNLERAELAYLSACSTALMSVVTLGSVEFDPALRAELPDLAAAMLAVNQNADLVDEAIHLSSAFQLAGFRHVVSTLWEIDDAAAVQLADDFYAGLRGDAGSSARALHDAVRALRDRRPRLPSLWASYLHAGA